MPQQKSHFVLDSHSALGALALCSLLILAATASAQTYKVIYNFGNPPDGAVPAGQMVFDSAGNLYGTANGGGAFGWGAVFQLSPPTVSGGAWTETILYSFTNKGDGGIPYSGITIDRAGNLYGATYIGGSSSCGCGTVFKMKPPATSGGTWSFRTMYRFLGGTADGYGPVGPVSLDKSGNLYGTTFQGGTYLNSSTSGFSGVVYKLTPSGGGWTESILWNFGGPGDGAYTYSGLTFDSSGNMYGTTCSGGATGNGTVVQLVPPASGLTSWTESVIYSFPAPGAPAGDCPLSSLIIDSHGNLFGTATGLNGTCCGAVFRLTPPTSGTTWNHKTLYTFNSTTNGQYPKGLVHDAKTNNLYGIAINNGGGTGNGVVFKLTPGSQWTYSVTHDFNGTDTSNPQTPPVIGADGNIYGAAYYGGSNFNGVIYQITP